MVTLTDDFAILVGERIGNERCLERAMASGSVVGVLDIGFAKQAEEVQR